MTNHIRELSIGDLDTVIGGALHVSVTSTTTPPNSPIVTPPPYGHGPVVLPKNGPIVFGPGILAP